MLFNVLISNPDQSSVSLIIQGNSWSNCLSYLEGTGKKISMIQSLDNAEVNVIGELTKNSYIIQVRDNTTLVISNIILYSNLQDMIALIQSFVDKTFLSVGNQQRELVTI